MDFSIANITETVARWWGEPNRFGRTAKGLALPQTMLIDQAALAQRLPYQSYDPELKLFTNKNSMGFVLEASLLTGASEEIETILTSLFTDVLPFNADVHFLLWASNKVEPMLEAFVRERSKSDNPQYADTLKWLAQHRVDFLRKGSYESLAKDGYSLLRDFKLWIDVGIPVSRFKKNAEKISAQLIDLRQDLSATLRSVNIETRDLPIDQFIGDLSDLLSPSLSTTPTQCVWNQYETLNSQLTDPECRLRVFKDRLLFETDEDETDVRSFTVKRFPHMPWSLMKMTENIGQLFNTILQIPCPFVISFSLRALDPEKSSLKTQMTSRNKKKNLGTTLSDFNPNAEDEYHDWEKAKFQMAKGERLVKTFFQIITYSKPATANSIERRVRDLYQANGWKLRKEMCVQYPAWLAMLPMMMSEGLFDDFNLLHRLRTVSALNAVTISPLLAEWKGTRRYSLLLPGRRGQLANWNPFDNAEGNYNVAIAAKSGSGKSVLSQEYIMSMLGGGGRVWVIDVGRSYEKTCHLLGGEYVEFTPDGSLCINPFTHIRDFNESLGMLKPLLATMARPTTHASEEELAWLEKALKAVWSEMGTNTTITLISHWLEQQGHPLCKNLAHLLFSYTRYGMYGRYFEGPCTIELANSFVVLELEELKSKRDLQKVVLLTLMYHITEVMYLGERSQHKSCIIDEAWDLMKESQREAADFAETGYRRARRYNGNFVTITQSINDYFSNPMALAAYENSDWKIILQQNAETLSRIKDLKRLEIDPLSEKMLRELKKTDDYSECLIKGPSGYSVQRIILDPYSRILFSSRGEDVEAVRKYQALGLSLHEAIDKIARKFNDH